VSTFEAQEALDMKLKKLGKVSVLVFGVAALTASAAEIGSYHFANG
jgi:hypothetical protein